MNIVGRKVMCVPFGRVVVRLNHSAAVKSAPFVRQLIEKVNCFTRINIQCAYNLDIRAYDIIGNPDANVLRATLISSDSSFDGNDFRVEFDPNADVVHIVSGNSGSGQNVTCELEIPVSADIDVESTGNVAIKRLYNSLVNVRTPLHVQTTDVRTDELTITSGQNIECRGVMLSKNALLKATNGHIALDKVQGDYLEVQTECGDISVNSCYSEHSRFRTTHGNITLNNLHKKSEVDIHRRGNLAINGFNGTLTAKVSDGSINLQICEMYGNNVVIGYDCKESSVHMSDHVEENCYIQANCKKIVHNNTKWQITSPDGRMSEVRAGNKLSKNRFFYQTDGSVTLGKMSWAESVKLKLQKLNQRTDG